MVAFSGVSGQLYEWSCSPLDATDNRFTLPYLAYEDDENVARFENTFELFSNINVDIYSVPTTLNCSGKVSALEYCYAGIIDATISFHQRFHAFTLLILKQSSPTFTVIDKVDVFSTPVPSICSQGRSMLEYCCDRMSLDAVKQFSLPAPDFAFGIIPSATLYVRHRTEFIVRRYSFTRETVIVEVGSSFEPDGAATNTPLPLFRFLISKSQ